jgi:PAS domain S-box-containing protein
VLKSGEAVRSGAADKTPAGALSFFALTAAFGALMFLGLASYDTLVHLQRDRDTRFRASVTLARFTSLLAYLSDAEAGQRGYLLTGNREHLQPYDAGRAAIAADTLELRRAAISDTLLASGLTTVVPLIGAKLAFMDSTVRLYGAGRRAAALARVTSGRGKQLMDSVRNGLAYTASWLQRELDERSVRVNAGWRRAKLSMVFSGVLALATFGASSLVVAAQFRARTRAEREARARESELFQMLEAMPVGVFVIDAQGKPYYTNQRSRDILGKDTEAGTPLGQLPETYHAHRAGSGELYPAEAQPIARALRGEHNTVHDVEIHRPDRIVPLEVWGAPVFDREGRVTYAIAAFSDMTEREAARRELEAVNKELETFSYSVSHDLRSPLRAIDGFSRILEQEHSATLDADATRLLGVIRANTQRMGRLIDDLLTFARFSRQELRAESVDMEGLARSVLDDLRQNGAADGRAAVTVGSLPAARGDQGLLRQVWMNLLSNALKYSRTVAQPQVVVEAELRGAAVEYRVRDNGVGFDMAYAGKLFGVFQRLHRADEFEGTGVGLATVQRIVHRHGGRIWADARPGAGATFAFTLPAEE